MKLTSGEKTQYLTKAADIAQSAAAGGHMTPKGIIETLEGVYTKLIELAEKD